MAYSQLQLDKQLCHRLYMASNGLIRAYRPLLEALDLTYPQYVVMMALWQQDDISIQTLLTKTAIDGGAMSLILQKMQTKQLLSMTANEDDKRKKHIRLTQHGHALKLKAATVPAQIQCVLPAISQDDVKTLIGLLDKVCGNLNQV
jgi:DNA-binding MarR family transcriptional regulator